MKTFDFSLGAPNALVALLEENEYSSEVLNIFCEVLLESAHDWMLANDFGSGDPCANPILEAKGYYAPDLENEPYAICRLVFGITKIIEAVDDGRAADAAMAAIAAMTWLVYLGAHDTYSSIQDEIIGNYRREKAQRDGAARGKERGEEAKARRGYILKRIDETDGQISKAELARECNVRWITISRDFKMLGLAK